MTKLIVLKLDGNFLQGFRATLEIGLEGERPEVEIMGNLPPATELVEQYTSWQSTYRSLGKVTRVIKPKRAKIDGSLKKRREECRLKALELRNQLNTWLKVESFFPIRDNLLETASTSEQVRVMIRAENDQIWQLPWHQWDLLERYNQVEIGFSNLNSKPPPKQENFDHFDREHQLRILAILGNSEGIQVEEDRQQLLNFPGAEITFLVEPQRQELNDQLWERRWDILFFAGHSWTEGATGQICLNQTDRFSLDELRYALKKAVSSGLLLAIFNSCDGLGLARELKKIHIPQMIVMREPVPDRVAQTFLKYFLQAFACGKSFYISVREARQRLQGLEDEFPCASWLPIICQNSTTVSLTQLKLPVPVKNCPKSFFWSRWQTVFLTSLFVTSLVFGMRSLGVLQTLELESYDQILRQRPPELPDARLLIVGADEADIQQYKYPLPDTVLAQAIAKLEQHGAIAIGLDIFRDQPVPPGHELLVAQLRQKPRLFTVCSFGTRKEQAVAPPPDSPDEKIGFNDLEKDADNTVRRHLLSRTPNEISSCNTGYSLSLELANQYLEAQAEPISATITPEKNWQFDQVILKNLESRSGGYQNLDARGNQILINYRATDRIAQHTVTIKDILTGKLKPEWVKNRVVLIGVTAASVQDEHNTPYGKMRGLEVHAHMVSQILSAVENRRPLIWWLPLWDDALWVWFWSLTGGVVVWQVRVRSPRPVVRRLRLVLVLSISTTFVYGVCWVFLLQGGWLPLFPAILALMSTGGIIAYIPFQSSSLE
ncbi:transmembrane sensor domain-containing protein [Scytonema hofmannii PCC 7110]|uniref:Transmembrane sensor domain-containing protein n=1 Tax=Scytonema hofmannii PCC 7110 TaxID=128403 RepID=A0A139WY76_9CYAN|nr:CHASE2 domain-containing protein [Scytonema hofmannii]KYC37380.1 transmembrane sensor domain-containing protein [Scytonema hofmannii PCC 7110]